MHRATCVECGNGCEVPFKPNGSKPIYCRDCFKRDDQGGSDRRFNSRDSRGFDRDEKRSFPATCASCGDRCEVPFKPNGSKPVYCRGCFDKAGDAPSVTRYERKSAPAPAADYADEFRSIHAKLDLILKGLDSSPKKKAVVVEAALSAAEAGEPAVAEEKEAKKAKAPAKKKAVVKKKTTAKKKTAKKK